MTYLNWNEARKQHSFTVVKPVVPPTVQVQVHGKDLARLGLG
jgi:hypothetical protein